MDTGFPTTYTAVLVGLKGATAKGVGCPPW